MTASSTFQLTEGQLAFFEQGGYLAINQLTDQEEVSWLREVYDRIFTEQAGRDSGDQFDLAGTDEDGQPQALPQILNPAKYAPELNDSKLLANASALCRQLFGEEATTHIAHAIYKPARHGAETPWHQDAAYWKPNLTYQAVSIWVPLQEATLDNGCMQFVPGSHRLDVVQHQSINNDPRIHGLELHPDELWRTAGYVSCPLPPGGATIHGGYMLHHTPPNRSDIPRRALILIGGLKPQELAEPRCYPWLEEKQTQRQQRAQLAQAAVSKQSGQ